METGRRAPLGVAPPPAPRLAEPERRITLPLVPANPTPVAMFRAPLTPAVPALAVRTLKEPLDVARFLIEGKGLGKRPIGEYLGKPQEAARYA